MGGSPSSGIGMNSASSSSCWTTCPREGEPPHVSYQRCLVAPCQTFLSQRGQELSPVWFAADIIGVSRKNSSLLSSSVPPRPLSRHSVSEAASMSISTKDAEASWPSPAQRCNQQLNYRRMSEGHTPIPKIVPQPMDSPLLLERIVLELRTFSGGEKETIIQRADCTGMSICWSLLTHYDNCVPAPARKIRHMVEGAKNGPWHGGAYL